MSEMALRYYLTEIEKYYKAEKATEHTYRGTLRALLETLDRNISATNEPKRVKCGAPDYAIERNSLTIGYIEAKDIGLSLDKIEKDEQLKRYRHALDNLILTDYLEFRWYVGGERRMTATLATLGKGKNLVLDQQGAGQVAELLRSFLEHSAEPIRKPQELARRMARLTHMIRNVIVIAFQEKEASDNLKDLYTAFQDVLLPELTEPDFADMFAQTLAYGLFAARYNHTQTTRFSRNDAAKEIPRTNPFLRKLFGSIAGPDLDDEPFVGFVDELAQTLAYTDMDLVMVEFGRKTRQEDPIVHFYETFLAQYDPKLQELRGVYYTPEPVVSYIVRSVDSLLRTHFDCPDGLADTGTVSHTLTNEAGEEQTELTPRVLILDPATGTATFLYHVIAHIRESYRRMGNAGMWSSYVREHLLPRLFGFELLIAPYAMAHLKLGMQLAAVDLPAEERATWAYDFKTDERLGIYLTNTLDEALRRSKVMFGRYISDEANEAAKVKQDEPVMVVLGNPPYSGHSANRSWKMEDKKKVPNFIGKLLQDYYQVDGHPLGERNPKWLQDDYVKFIRFAQWRVEQTGYGILAFITNHGYLDNPTFRGMRQNLMECFDEIYVLDLHGNSKKQERSPDGSKDQNIFDIQQGVAIGIFIKQRAKKDISSIAKIYHAHLWGPREIHERLGHEQRLTGGKYRWLAENDVSTTEWELLHPQSPLYLFRPQDIHLRDEYEQGWVITKMMPEASLGCLTKRDNLVIGQTKEELRLRISQFINSNKSDKEAVEEFDLSLIDKDMWNASIARKSIKNDDIDKFIRRESFRPFDKRYIFYHEKFVARLNRRIMHHLDERNLALVCVRQLASLPFEHVWVTNELSDQHLISVRTKEGGVVFPLYLYPNSNRSELFGMSKREPNLSQAFTAEFAQKIKMDFVSDTNRSVERTFGPEDIFNYMYAVFHSPTYRTRYAEFLKIDFPRLPLTSKVDLFRELCQLGERLVAFHLMEKFGKITARFPESGSNMIEKISYTVDPKEPEKGRVWINKVQYIEGVAPEVWEFHVGGYQVCEKWLKDRKGRQLTFSDLQHYQHVVAALAETIALMEQIDETIEAYGGWPIQ